MRIFRLEKPNYVMEWVYAILKSLALSLVATICLMLIMGYKFMIVSSASMEPTLPVGSFVIVTPCDYEKLKCDDIVTFQGESGTNYTHRIVGKTNSTGGVNSSNLLKPGDKGYDNATYWVTQGDYSNPKYGGIGNEDKYDGALTKTVLGKVYPSHCFAFTGYIVRYVKANYIMIIALLIILISFIEVMSYLKRKLIEDDIECYENDEE